MLLQLRHFKASWRLSSFHLLRVKRSTYLLSSLIPLQIVPRDRTHVVFLLPRHSSFWQEQFLFALRQIKLIWKSHFADGFIWCALRSRANLNGELFLFGNIFYKFNDRTVARRSLVECWTSHERLVSRTNLSHLQQEAPLWHTLLMFHPHSHSPVHAHRPRHACLAIINLWSWVVVFVFAAHLPPLSSSCSAWRQQLWRRNFVNRVFPLATPFYFNIFFLVSRVAFCRCCCYSIFVIESSFPCKAQSIGEKLKSSLGWSIDQTDCSNFSLSNSYTMFVHP